MFGAFPLPVAVKSPHNSQPLLSPTLPMHITDIFAAHRTTFSFEFFPPKTVDGAGKLFESIAQLEPCRRRPVKRATSGDADD